MPSVLSAFAVVLLFLVPEPAPENPWVEVRLTITRDPYTSSDDATLCRVRAVNLGGRSWSGKALRFEARARAGSRVVKQRGRFGGELAPYASMETIVALPGRHDRLDVVPVPVAADDASFERDPSGRRKTTRRKAKKGGW
ncbi:MAG TPA: hypothetical protein VH854_10605 [Thermoanaerobaculia bacterium]|jgi:hypothetical protein|nr:hypothetical protein [Thermoanaerobaculia bacterium]